jgi:signal transduction histidine kinase
MSLPLILGALWVVASAIVAMLPMRRQYAPGIALLIAAPVLLVWIGASHGWVWTAFGVFAFVSMFRNPLRYLAARALGRPLPPLPQEPERRP